MPTLEQHLQTYFSHSAFRPGQREIVEAILAGRDVVALMPTGGGKSLCYQLPALLSDKVSLIISPLIALMKDQVDTLNARGIPATYINSSLPIEEVYERLDLIRNKKVKMIYVAPERLSLPSFRNELANIDIQMVAVDEAHCVSSWGHDFRPDYLLIHEFLRQCKTRPVVAAFTATATPEVSRDIQIRLELRDPAVFVRGFDRPNLKFFVRTGVDSKHRYREVLRLIQVTRGAAVAYTLSRKGAEELAEYLDLNGVSAAAYHAGMTGYDRARIQEDFMENRIRVIVATVAFGMGIDKADIRLVLHVGAPASLESYYQEAGRAGRDGEPAYCILLPTGKDMSLHKYFIRKGAEEMQAQGKDAEAILNITNSKYARLEEVQRYIEPTGCRRRKILSYFADSSITDARENCGGCDTCLNYAWKEPVAEEAEEEKRVTPTIQETVRLYEEGYDVDQIAKFRGLGKTTIWGHLVRWYECGGNLPTEKYLTPEEEYMICEVLNQGEAPRLKVVKERLPAHISYEQIKLAMAKLARERK